MTLAGLAKPELGAGVDATKLAAGMGEIVVTDGGVAVPVVMIVGFVTGLHTPTGLLPVHFSHSDLRCP